MTQRGRAVSSGALIVALSVVAFACVAGPDGDDGRARAEAAPGVPEVSDGTQPPDDSLALQEEAEALQQEVAALEQEAQEREALIRQREEEIARLEELRKHEAELLERERAAAEREARLAREQERIAQERAALVEAEAELRRARAEEEARRRADEERRARESAVARDAEREGGARADRDEESTQTWTGREEWRRGNREPAPAPVEERPAPVERLRAGERIEVELSEALSSRSSQVGDRFRSRVVEAVLDRDGTVIVPAGSTLVGEVVEARPLKKVGGQAALGLEFYRLELPTGESVELKATLLQLGRNKKGDKKKIAGAAIAGAILGKIIGDGDYGLIGAAAGAAAGTAAVMRAEGRDVEIPAGTTIELEIEEIVSVETRFGGPVRDR